MKNTHTQPVYQAVVFNIHNNDTKININMAEIGSKVQAIYNPDKKVPLKLHIRN